jgi:hypothetical protein
MIIDSRVHEFLQPSAGPWGVLYPAGEVSTAIFGELCRCSMW